MMDKGEKTIFLLLTLLLTPMLLAVLVQSASADTNESFDVAKVIIDQGIPCNQLNQTQLETVGDYYMELMHPGAAHEAMDAMMGGDSSPSLEAMHVAMAERFYCGGGNATAYGTGYDYGMMGGYGNGMMGGYGNGMMGGYGNGYNGYGMMGHGYGSDGSGYAAGNEWWWLQHVIGMLTVLLLVALIVLAVVGSVKLAKSMRK